MTSFRVQFDTTDIPYNEHYDLVRMIAREVRSHHKEIGFCSAITDTEETEEHTYYNTLMIFEP